MSKKTRPRRGAPAGRAPATKAPGRRDPNAAGELASLLAAIAAGEPLRAELETAAWMAIPHAMGGADADEADAFVYEVLVNGAARTRMPEGAALLRVLMSLGSPAVKKTASHALGRLTSAGVYPPDWVTEVGKAVPGQAWRRYDVHGDDEFIAVTFRYGDAEHGIMVHVDLTSIPVAIAAGVAADPAGLIEAMNREDDQFERHERIGLAEARRRVEAPLARSGREPDPGISRDTLTYLPVVRSRVRRLPAEEPGQAPAYTAADRAAAVAEFLTSPQAAEAAAADAESTRFWAEVLTGYSSRTPGEPPARVGPRTLAHLLLGHVPGTFILSPAQRQHLGPAVTAWACWAAESRGLDQAAAERLISSVPEVLGRFDRAYDDQDAAATRGYLAGLAASDADLSVLAGHRARRMFAVPLPEPDEAGRRPDVSDRAARRALAEAEFGTCAPPEGMTSEQFVAAADRVVSELWHDEPESTFAAARHLFAGGAGRHEIIHALAQEKGAAAAR